MNLAGSFVGVFGRFVNQAVSLAASALQRSRQMVLQALNRIANLVISTLQRAFSRTIAPLLNRLSSAAVQAITRGEQSAVAQIRANQKQSLEALALVVAPRSGGGATGITDKGAPRQSPTAVIQAIGANAIQNNRLIT